jgi:hypothetical protein
VLLLLVGAGVAVLAFVALSHPSGREAANAKAPATVSTAASSRKPTATAKPTASKTAPKTVVQPSVTPTGTTSAAGTGRLPLIVLNNTSGTSASVAAQRFEQGGWTVTDTSTFSGSILSTAAYYDPGVAGAQAAAEQLQQQFPAIKRVKARFDGLPAGPVVVVLTSDYS